MAIAINSKRVLIDKSNSTIVAVTAVAAFVIIFCLVASKALISQELYQGRVISKKKVALSQLKSDITDSNSLLSSYKAFISPPTNLLGGNPTGTGAQDGNNAKLVLDALPSQYDFPALATSLGTLITGQGLKINSITGTDDEVAQQSTLASGDPQPVPMPFSFVVEGSYEELQALISRLQQSIRPFQIQTMNISGSQSDVTATITAQTYYQPAKTLNITEETVK
jgi:hypothetical protein